MKFFSLVIVLCMLVFSSCTSRLDTMVINNISEERIFVLEGRSDGVMAELMCGYRESDYNVNGYSSQLIEFGILTIRFVDSQEFDSVNYTLFVGVDKFSGEMQKNPFEDSYVVDLKTIIDDRQNILIEIDADAVVYCMKMFSPMIEWTIDSRRALDIFIDKYSRELKLLVGDNAFGGEIYIKIVGDYDKYGAEYMYYVSCVDRQGECLSMIVSPKTGNILASSK